MAGREEHSANREAAGSASSRGSYEFSGPTYRDVRELATAMERMYGRPIQFYFGPGDLARRWESSLLHVRARLAGPEGCDRGADWGGAYHGGNRGAKTLPGAMIQALHNLDEALSCAWASDAEPSP